MYYDLRGNLISFEIDEKMKIEIMANIKNILKNQFKFNADADDELISSILNYYENKLSQNNHTDGLKNYLEDLDWEAENDYKMGRASGKSEAKNLLLARDAVIMLTIALKKRIPSFSNRGYISYGAEEIIFGDEYLKKTSKTIFAKPISKFWDKDLSESQTQVLDEGFEFEGEEEKNLPNIDDGYYRD